jgi:hypothetical protein
MDTIDINRMQSDLSRIGNERVTDKAVAEALHLSPKTGASTVRRMKDGELSGPAITALQYMVQGLPDANGEYTVPEFVIGESPASAGSLFIVRLRYPRFVGWIEGRVFGAASDRLWHTIEGTESKMTVLQWIDRRNFGNLAPGNKAVADACRAIRDRVLDDR